MTTDPGTSYRNLQRMRVNTNTDVLLKRFENIMQLVPMTIERKDAEGKTISTETKDKHIAAAEAFQIETHASAIIRAAEDMLALSRMLKEAWLFGQLGTGAESDKDKEEADADAKVVGAALKGLLGREENFEG